MKETVLAVLCLVGSLLLPPPPAAAGEGGGGVHLEILFTNDVQGYIEPCG